jgi:hypothetical protein
VRAATQYPDYPITLSESSVPMSTLTRDSRCSRGIWSAQHLLAANGKQRALRDLGIERLARCRAVLSLDTQIVSVDDVLTKF